MNTRDNKATVKAFYAAGDAGELDRALGLLADDVTWTNIGSTDFSGTYSGKETLNSSIPVHRTTGFFLPQPEDPTEMRCLASSLVPKRDKDSVLRWICLLSVNLLYVACSDVGYDQVNINYFRFPESSAEDIHDITVAALEKAPQWNVSQVPSMSIGGNDEQVAFGRLTYALRLPDGRLLGSDGLRPRILVFDTLGNVIDEWGRKGSGPGEFQYPIWLGLCGPKGPFAFDALMDLLVAFDWSGDPLGVSRMTLPGGGRTGGALACTSDGNVAIGGYIDYPQHLAEGPFRPFVTFFVRLLPNGEFHRIASVAGVDSYRWSRQMGPMGDFARRPLVAVVDSSLFLATGDAFEVAKYDFEGNLLMIIRADGIQRPPVTSTDLARVRREQIEAQPEEARPHLRTTLASMKWPEFQPAVDGLAVDSEGCLWLRQVLGNER